MVRAIAAWVDALPPGDDPVALAVSGGRDSMALLDAASASLRARGRRAIGLHIHHGLHSAADRWAAFCAQACAARGVAYAERRVAVARRPRSSIEALAREARYAALRELALAHGARIVALAHHQDDQAETLILQLGRGAGPAGLAAMPAVSTDATGIAWCRPLLGVPRAAIDAYVVGARIAWVDDPSNADGRWRRNAVRARIAPAFAATFPGYPATLARAAAHQADAVSLADALAGIDARGANYDAAGGTIDAGALASLPAARARNLLRWFLHVRGLPPPSAARLDAMLRQLARARRDATVGLAHAGAVVGRHRGRVAVHAVAPEEFLCAWRGESVVALPHGVLAFERVEGAGVDARHLDAGLAIRPRRGGERLRLERGRARRALKSLLRESGLPAWEREALPLVVAGDTLVAVPGIGVDVAWRAAPGQPGWVPVWRRAATLGPARIAAP
ncbi:tRNA(Ile)-lysidine synthase [Burkholderiales bacterium]|nr:tRNA(Ile)-lysidine synthase [Burkholderiales bacterium]